MAAERPTFHVFRCADGGGRPRWQDVSREDLADPLHPIRTSGLNLQHRPMPCALLLPQLRVLCRHLCLSCRLIDCAEHPAGSQLRLDADGGRAQLDVTDPALLERLEAPLTDPEAHAALGTRASLRDVLAPSLVEETRVLESATGSPLEARLYELPAEGACLFCGAPAEEGDHAECPGVELELQRDGSALLRFESEEDAQRWRASPSAGAEAVVVHVARTPDWAPGVCRCCGRAGLPSPCAVAERSLSFQSAAHLQRWHQAHGQPAGRVLERHAFELLNAVPWQGGCRCCGREGADAPAPRVQRNAAGDAELHFPSAAAAAAWAARHPEVGAIAGPLHSRSWRFGPAELLPLLRAMRDYEAHEVVDETLFTRQHVVRCLEGCEGREALAVVRQAREVERLDLLIADTVALRVPLLRRRAARSHLARGEDGALQGRVDALGRLEAGSLVRQGDELARYVVAGEVEPLILRLEGEFELQWREDCGPAAADVALLRRRTPSSAAERQRAERELMLLLRDALMGRQSEPRSAMQLGKRLETGKHLMRGDNGTLRAQAETAAHRFPAGAVAPPVAVSHAQALGMKVLRVFDGSREDLLAILNGPRTYPGVWQLVVGGSSPSLRPPPDLRHELPAGARDVQSARRAYATELERRHACCRFARAGLPEDAPSAETLRAFEAAAASRELRQLAREIRAARRSERLARRELLLCKLEAWCRTEGVTHLIAHPVNQDRYYVVRNPVDNAGSVECVTLMVVPGTARGAGFSALLLVRFGMDHDGDHANFVAVLDVVSAALQEAHFGPENRLFMETGALVGGPTKWPLARWDALLAGDQLRLRPEDARNILAGAGLAGALLPAREVRARAHHRPGTLLRFCEGGQLASVVSPRTAEERATARALAHPLLAAPLDGRSPLVVERADVCRPCAHGAPLPAVRATALYAPGEQLAYAAAPAQPALRVLGEETRAGPREPLIWLETPSGERGLCSPADVWREALGGADLLGCLLATLPRGAVVRLPETGQEIWRGGEAQVLGGALCSLQVPRRAGPAWEALTLHLLLRRRRGEAAAAKLAASLAARPACPWRRLLRARRDVLALRAALAAAALRGHARRPPGCSCAARPAACAAGGSACWRPLRWALLALRARAAHNAPPPGAEGVRQLLTGVARERGKLAALELATKLQMTGYRICPTVAARAQRPPTAEEQEAVETCVRALDWNAHAALPFPREAEATARLRFRALAEPCRELFGKLAAGMRSDARERCGRCLDCQARARQAPAPRLTLAAGAGAAERRGARRQARASLAALLLDAAAAGEE